MKEENSCFDFEIMAIHEVQNNQLRCNFLLKIDVSIYFESINMKKKELAQEPLVNARTYLGSLSDALNEVFKTIFL